MKSTSSTRLPPYHPPLFCSVAVLAFILGAVPARADIIHEYQFQNTLNDSVGTTALVSNGGTLGLGSYTFGAGQGLHLNPTGLSNLGTYSIVIDFDFASFVGQNGSSKIIDFQNLTRDIGLYASGGPTASCYCIHTR